MTSSTTGQVGVSGPGMTQKLVNEKTGSHECNNLADTVTKTKRLLGKKIIELYYYLKGNSCASNCTMHSQTCCLSGVLSGNVHAGWNFLHFVAL